MAALSDLAPRLSKLIPRLASNHDGEVVATVAAIRRTLEADGLDLHDLAEGNGKTHKPKEMYPTKPDSADPSRSHKKEARRCMKPGIAWRPKKAQFLRQMAEHLRRPTEKQRDRPDGLLDRTDRHNRK